MDAKSLFISAKFETYLNFILERVTGDHEEQIDCELIPFGESTSSTGFSTNVTWEGKLPLIEFCRQTNNTVDPSEATSYANLKEMLVFPVFFGPHINKRCGICIIEELSPFSVFLIVDHIHKIGNLTVARLLPVDSIIILAPKNSLRISPE
jgi:hypothetical protein